MTSSLRSSMPSAIHAKADGSSFTHEELLGLCVTLMIGGIDNTYRLISAMLWRLSWDVGLRRNLISHPELISSAVEESLRYYSPAFTGRVVTRDAEFRGGQMRAGDLVLIGNPLANRDPRAFSRPNEFIVDRNPSNHIALGMGIHRCLGAHLIALEAMIVIEEFLKRLPEFSFDSEKQIRWVGGQVGGIENLPVRFPIGKPRAIAHGRQQDGVEAWLSHARTDTSERQ